MPAFVLHRVARTPALLAGLTLLLAGRSQADDFGVRLAAAAREQVGVTVVYDGAYQRLRYPGGDVPVERGVCTDVVVRAFRRLGIDLQVEVHEDMGRAWEAYPRAWGLSRRDRNIDHRRVPNLATWLRRHGQLLGTGGDATSYEAGDLVTWRLPSGLPHIGIVSDRANGAGVPLVIHNIGAGTAEEDVLFAWTVTGHFRYRPR